MSRPLHLGGAARYKSESQRPDLWPDYMVSPSLGKQGAVLIDVVGGRNVELTKLSSDDWVLAPYGYALNFDGTNDYAKSPDFDAINIGDGSADKPITIFMRFKLDDLNTRYLLSHSKMGDTGSYQWIIYTRSPDNSIAFIIYDGKASNWIRRMMSISSGVWYNFFLTYDGRGGSTAYNGMEFYLNGVKGGSYTDTLTGTYVAAHSLTGSNLTIGSGQVSSTTTYMDGLCGGISVWPRVLSESQIIQLSADPLLPFRRKTMISLYVPSGAPAGLAHNIFGSPVFGKLVG